MTAARTFAIFGARGMFTSSLFKHVWSLLCAMEVNVAFAIIMFDITRFDGVVEWLKDSAY